MKNNISGARVPFLMGLLCLFLTGCPELDEGEDGIGTVRLAHSQNTGGYYVQWELFSAGKTYGLNENEAEGVCSRSSFSDSAPGAGDCIIPNNVKKDQWLQVTYHNITPVEGVTGVADFRKMLPRVQTGTLEYCRDYPSGSPYRDASKVRVTYPAPVDGAVPGGLSSDQCWVARSISPTREATFIDSLSYDRSQRFTTFFVFINGYAENSTPNIRLITQYLTDEPSDRDNDGLLDEVDSCKTVPSPTHGFPHRDYDFDGLGDECDSDLDGDGVENIADFCPHNAAYSLFSRGEKIWWVEDTGEAPGALCDDRGHRQLEESVIIGDIDCTSYDTLANTGFWGRARLWMSHHFGSKAGFNALIDWYYKNRVAIDASEGGLEGELDRQFNYLNYLRYQPPGGDLTVIDNEVIYEKLGFSEKEIADLFKSKIDYFYAPVVRLVYYGRHKDVLDEINDISLLVDADTPVAKAVAYVAELYEAEKDIMTAGNATLGLDNNPQTGLPMVKVLYDDAKNKAESWVSTSVAYVNEKEKGLLLKHLAKVSRSYEFDPDSDVDTKTEFCVKAVKELALNSFAVGFVETVLPIATIGYLFGVVETAAKGMFEAGTSAAAAVTTISAAITVAGVHLTFEFLEEAVARVGNADSKTDLWGGVGTLAGAIFAPVVSEAQGEPHSPGDNVEVGESLEFGDPVTIALREAHSLKVIRAVNEAVFEAVKIKVSDPALRADITPSNLLSGMKYVRQSRADLDVYKVRVESSEFPEALRAEAREDIKAIEESVDGMEKTALDELTERCSSCPCI